MRNNIVYSLIISAGVKIFSSYSKHIRTSQLYPLWSEWISICLFRVAIVEKFLEQILHLVLFLAVSLKGFRLRLPFFFKGDSPAEIVSLIFRWLLQSQKYRVYSYFSQNKRLLYTTKILLLKYCETSKYMDRYHRWNGSNGCNLWGAATYQLCDQSFLLIKIEC